MHSFRFARLWLTLGWVLIAIVVFLSVWPHPPGEVGISPGGKLGHVIAYLVVMLWFANIYPHRHHRVWLSVAFFAM